MNDCAIRLPNEDKWLDFKNYCNKERFPFIIYADLECTLRRMEPERENTSYTYQQQHKVFSVGYYVRCSYDDALSAYQFRRGKTMRCMVRSATRKFGASNKNFVIRECPYGNIIERSVGDIP
ncbi:uncharacterized protein LOC112552897 [Pogonomyrmex barbatus]|uniref:Uncharacterized protein LOC112552897 n=1 Tax=Pogonomyrmex barbatus TaxID=144034 RepID=A0A8N1S867_9HYME|nr:uncharacterized protein LOC112552897 [Pogonomyrmex barbatus]